MRRIPLTQGFLALVDDSDYERVSNHSWSTFKGRHTFYAVASIRYSDSLRKNVYLHRFVLQAQCGQFVDHKDGNGLNCTRRNLRLCTKAENNRYRRKKQTSRSLYKGVIYCKGAKRWMAYIRGIYLGLYPTAEAAALVYDNKARKLFGEFAYLNFPDHSVVAEQLVLTFA